jgi:hypothetical protein
MTDKHTTKQPCFNWENTGTCNYGDNCGFEHDQNKKGRGRTSTQKIKP